MSSTNKKMSNHIDKLVVYLFVVVFLISALVLAYQINKYTPCKEVNFVVKSGKFTEGNLIRFIDGTLNATSWEWDFGDSTKVLTGKDALHVYKKPGEYNVRLTVNGICEEIKKVVIKEKPFIIDSTKLAVFELPATIRVGKPLVITDKTDNATTWEWRFGETAGVNSNQKTAKYTYETLGLKTVSLVVNGDIKHVTSKKIEVLPIKKTKKERINQISAVRRTVGKQINEFPTTTPLGVEEKDKKPKKTPYISNEQFKNKLILVTENKISAEAFNDYLCDDLNKQIIVNGKITTFLEFCELIKNKKLKIKKVNLFRNEVSNCIKNITIKRSKFIF